MYRADAARASASKPPWQIPKSSRPSPGCTARQRAAQRWVRPVASLGVGAVAAPRHRLVEAHHDVGVEPRLEATPPPRA